MVGMGGGLRLAFGSVRYEVFVSRKERKGFAKDAKYEV